VNRSLLDTDILSEILKGINQTVARNQSIRQRQKFLTDISGEEVKATARDHHAYTLF
jgi:hypothetical protein